MKLGYIALGSYGSTLRLTDPEKHPRKQLLSKLGRNKATRIYRDDKYGNPKHIGYEVAGEWFDIFEIHEWNGNEPQNGEKQP